MTFRIYSASSGGTALWSETQTVTITSGVLDAVLGAATAFPATMTFNTDYWVSVEVASDGEMSPRIRLTGAAYALNADEIDDIDSTQIVRNDTDNTISGYLTVQGDVTVGNASSDSFTINAATISLENAATLDLADSSTSALNIESGLFNLDTENARVGVGTTSPEATLQVSGGDFYVGTGTFTNTSSDPDIYVQGNVEIDGTLYATLSGSTDISSTTSTTFTVDSDNTSGTEPADGAGYVIEGGTGDASILWDATNSELDINQAANFSSNITVGGTTTLNAETYTWPAIAPTAGQILSSSAAGVLSWSADANTGTEISGTDNYLARFNDDGDNVEISGVVDGSDAVAITIDSSEQVGIGTTAPGSALEVAGTVSATTFDTNVAAAAVTLTGTALSADGTDAAINIAITPKGTGEVDITKVDIDDGTIDGTIIGGASAAAAEVTTLTSQDITSALDSTYDLGALGNEWAEAHIDTAYIGTLDSGTAITHTLDDAFDDGKVIDGANESANAVQIGDTNDKLLIYTAGTSPTIATNGTSNLTIAPDNANVLVGSATTGVDMVIAHTGADEFAGDPPIDASVATAALAISSNPDDAGDADGVIKLGKQGGNWEYIHYDASLASAGKFVFSAPLQVSGSSPASITFDDGADTQTLTFDSAQTYPFSFGDNVEVDGDLNVVGASPAALKFGSGDSQISLIYDPVTDSIRFTRGVFAQDFRNKVKNGSFEAFSALEEFHDYDPNYATDSQYATTYAWDTGAGYQGGWEDFAPDDWTYGSGKVFQQAPILFETDFATTGTDYENFQKDFTEGKSAVRLEDDGSD
ncbi:beta strand repeat-containing protein, partial [Candidatus Omnitrophota bacterium]